MFLSPSSFPAACSLSVISRFLLDCTTYLLFPRPPTHLSPFLFLFSLLCLHHLCLLPFCLLYVLVFFLRLFSLSIRRLTLSFPSTSFLSFSSLLPFSLHLPSISHHSPLLVFSLHPSLFLYYISLLWLLFFAASTPSLLVSHYIILLPS